MSDKIGIEIDSLWLPRASSTIAKAIDDGFWLATWLNVFFFIIVVGAMCVFAWKYRRRGPDDKVSQVAHNLPIEIIWTAIPFVLLMYCFFVGIEGYLNASVAPAESFEIHATGQKWLWTFTYPNGYSSSDLVVPVDKPVKIVMSSKDVIHSFFIPEFRVKNDVIPGQYTEVWFQANHVEETVIECTQYCGLDHSKMLAKVSVLDDKAFNEWLETAAAKEGEGMPVAEYGHKLFSTKSCETCHSLDGSIKTGPSFKGVYGRMESFVDGSQHMVDDNYIRESVMVPTAKVVKGFAPVMPPFKGVLNDHQIEALIAFIKSQK